MGRLSLGLRSRAKLILRTYAYYIGIGIEHPRFPDYLGLMIGTWVSLWLDFATIAIFDPIKPVYGQILPFYSFLQSKSGADKMIQYVPGIPQVYDSMR